MSKGVLPKWSHVLQDVLAVNQSLLHLPSVIVSTIEFPAASRKRTDWISARTTAHRLFGTLNWRPIDDQAHACAHFSRVGAFDVVAENDIGAYARYLDADHVFMRSCALRSSAFRSRRGSPTDNTYQKPPSHPARLELDLSCFNISSKLNEKSRRASALRMGAWVRTVSPFEFAPMVAT
jgi:hypothetical protein